jgi:hypothetical protein
VQDPTDLHIAEVVAVAVETAVLPMEVSLADKVVLAL